MFSLKNYVFILLKYHLHFLHFGFLSNNEEGDVEKYKTK